MGSDDTNVSSHYVMNVQFYSTFRGWLCFGSWGESWAKSAGLKNSWTRGVWYKSLEESHAAQIKEKSLLVHILSSEKTQKKILESDIFHILESEGVTGIGVLYILSPSKFVLVSGSKTAKEKLSGTVLVVLKYALISSNQLVLSEMEGNLSLSLSFFLSSLVNR